MRQVRGILFVDYVRMLRAVKSVDWSEHLTSTDLAYLEGLVEPNAWYPMETFERMGNAILAVVARGDLFPVQLWGRYSVAQLAAANTKLLVRGDPVETVTRFHALRQTFFDFDAVVLSTLAPTEAKITIAYQMGMPAEEAAAHQTMGFFEGLLGLAGAQNVRAELREKSWAGAPRTGLALRWRTPSAP